MQFIHSLACWIRSVGCVVCCMLRARGRRWRNGDGNGCDVNWTGRGAPMISAASSLVLLYDW
jgi:hypothetical protein